MDMNPHEIELSPDQQKRVADLAEACGVPWQDVLASALDRVAENVPCHAGASGIVGLFSNEPELADSIVCDAMRSRETDPLRR